MNFGQLIRHRGGLGAKVKVLVTGNLGFIGPHLIQQLKRNGHIAVGVDIDLFSGCKWYELPLPHKQIIKDFRKLTVEELVGYDCIMHLAAISNDPMGNLHPKLTYDINFKGSVELAKLAKLANVPRFLFASSCSVYGKTQDGQSLDESAELSPLSAYAESKIKTEKEVSVLSDESFCPIFLRNSTAYGNSPMLRIDLVVNNLLGCAFAKNEIAINSNGLPWRPLIHCSDIAKAFVALLDCPKDLVQGKAINIGSNDENYQVRGVAEAIHKVLPCAKIVFTGKMVSDPRDYKVNFDLLSSVLPDFKLDYTLQTGIEDLLSEFVRRDFNAEDFNGDQFVRMSCLKNSLSKLTAV